MATVSYARTNGTTQAQAAIDAIEDALTRQGAWAKVATIMSDTSQPCSVWRCTGNRNRLARDFYVCIGREFDTSPPAFSLAVAEGLDQGKRSLIRPAPSAAGAGANGPAEDFSFMGGTPVPIWSAAKLNPDISWRAVSISTNPTDVFAIVTNDQLTVHTRTVGNTSGVVCYAGLGEPFRDDDPGLVMVASTLGAGACTRHPTATAIDAANWQLATLTGATLIWTQRSGQIGADGDRLHNSRPVGSRVLARHTGTAASTGLLRGLLLNTLSIDTVPSTYAIGEKAFVNDDSYQYPGDTALDLWSNLAPT